MVAGDLATAGAPIFCPIAHSHPIAAAGGIDPLDHEFWMALDRPFMAAADILVVARLPGWEVSEGVRVEIDAFEAAGKPVLFLAVPWVSP